MQWFMDNHPDVPEHIEMTQRSARGVRRLLSLVNRQQLKRILRRMLDETEFFSQYGIRAFLGITMTIRTGRREWQHQPC